MGKKNAKIKSATKGSRLWGLLLFLVLVLIDQLTKAIADGYFVNILEQPNKRIPVIADVIELCIVYNRGIAFSMFDDADAVWKLCIVFGTAVLMVALAVLYCVTDKRRTLLRVALIFVVAGGIGNFIDRLYYQVWDPATATGIQDGVRDMFYLDFSVLLEQWFGWKTNFLYFGVCNVADFFIVGGGVMLVLAFLFFDRDAVLPVGKYKALAAEYEQAEKVKKARKGNKERKKVE